MGQQFVPRTVRRPAAKAFVDRLPRSVALRQIPPGRSGRELPQDPVHHLPPVPDRPPHPRTWQQRLHDSPRLISQLMTTHHDLPTSNPLCGHGLEPVWSCDLHGSRPGRAGPWGGTVRCLDVNFLMLNGSSSPRSCRSVRTGRTRRTCGRTSRGVVWRFRNGAKWRELPERFGSWSTVYGRFRQWRDVGVFPVLSAPPRCRERRGGDRAEHDEFGRAHRRATVQTAGGDLAGQGLRGTEARSGVGRPTPPGAAPRRGQGTRPRPGSPVAGALDEQRGAARGERRGSALVWPCADRTSCCPAFRSHPLR
jgi:transposase